MKCIDAYWDTRSLGKKTAEIVFERKDALADLQNAIAWSTDFEYIVLKVPCDNKGAIDYAQDAGFKYAESQYGMTLALNKLVVPRYLAKRESSFSWEEATPESAERVFSEINKGIFETDRIALDPVFGKEIAALRYSNWIRDELERGAKLYHCLYEGQEFSFVAMKTNKSGSEFDSFLAGLYPEWKTSGLGVYTTALIPARMGQELGCRNMVIRVSSSNLPMIKINEVLGATVNDITHLFIQHNDTHDGPKA